MQPHPSTLLHGALALLVSSLAPAAQTDLDPARLTALAERAHRAFGPPGLALAVVDGDEVVVELGVGVLEVGRQAAVTPRTPFNIASCTKAFTAASVGLLVARGELGWDDPVADHVPEFRMSDPWITEHLTVRDLLCHRSGLTTFAGDLLWYGSTRDDDAVLAGLRRLGVEQRFREQFGYQNLLYMVAGRVVESVDGRPWPRFVHEELFEPLGMQHTAVGLDALPAGAAPARPHIDSVPFEPARFHACKPAGAIWSSVHDLTLWMRMLLARGDFDGRAVVPPAVLAECWRPHTPVGRGGAGTPGALSGFAAYGLGWFLRPGSDGVVIEHDGGMPGFLSKVTLLPERRIGIAILINGMEGATTAALRSAIQAEIRGDDGDVVLERLEQVAARMREREAADRAERLTQRKQGTQPSRPLDEYAGTYEDALLGPAEIRLDGDALHLTVAGSPRTLVGALSHWHYDTFRVDFPDPMLPFGLIRFALNANGEVEAFGIDCPIRDFDFAALEFRRTPD